MSIFANLLKKKKQIVLSDPVFGEISFNKDMWTYIPPPNVDEPMIIIEAPEEGPSEEQRKYYINLKQRTSSIVSEAINFIKKEHISNLDLNKLGLYSIIIGSLTEIEKNMFVIELSDDKAEDIHRVEFENNQPIRYVVDD